MTRQRLWIAVVLGVTVLVAAGLAVVATAGSGTAGIANPADGNTARHERDIPGDCDQAWVLRDRQLTEPLTHGDRTIAVLGDSYSQGTGLSGPEVAWPAVLGDRLGAEVVLDGVGSTGFTTSGYCAPAKISFGERLAADPPHADVVVVQGGINDAILGRPDEVTEAAGDLLAELEDTDVVVVVGPAPVPAADPAAVATVDAALRAATDEAGRTYVPLIGAGVEIGLDRLHPTVAGQQRIAELVAAAIETADTDG
jgi:lysophospholipase L1-like esterase